MKSMKHNFRYYGETATIHGEPSSIDFGKAANLVKGRVLAPQQPVFAMVLVVGALAAAGSAAQSPTGEAACIQALNDPESERVACSISYVMAESARHDLQTVTGGLFLDARCTVNVDLARKEAFDALMAPDVLDVPPQAGDCVLVTEKQPIPVAFTAAPTVWFEQGRAVQAHPGVAHVAGLPPLLAKLLTDWINTSPMIETAVLENVNNYLDRGLIELPRQR